MVKYLPAMQETSVRSLGGEDPLEKGMITHSSILIWRIPWTIQSVGHKESDTTEQLSLSLAQGFVYWLFQRTNSLKKIFLALFLCYSFSLSPQQSVSFTVLVLDSAYFSIYLNSKVRLLISGFFTLGFFFGNHLQV